MKEDFEVNAAVDLTQSSKQWNFNPLGYASGHQLARPALDGHHTSPELSECMGHVLVGELSEASPETSIDRFSMDSLSTKNLPLPVSEDRPYKLRRRDHGNEAELHWHNLGENACTQSPTKSEEHGVHMITLLLDCAVSVSVDNNGEASRMLLELTQVASPYSSSCAERVVAYFTRAMASRVMNSWLGVCAPLVPHRSLLSAIKTFNTISPFIKFAHFTANQAILEAFHQKDRVHIIDLDVMQGLQWPAFFHILAMRPEGPPHVRMTGLGSSIDTLEETGRQLSNFAKRLGMSFEFHPIAKRFGDIEPSTVQTWRGETVAVHWLQHSLYDATGPDWKTLKLLELIAPTMITLVEQEMVHTGSFLDRFVGSLNYYSALFDSLGASLPCDDASRHHVEHGLLAREISNILAIGGPARSGEEKFVSWRAELVQLGFAQVPISGSAMAQAQLILNMFPNELGYTILQGDGTLRLGWKDTGLFTASAWTARLTR